MCRTIKINIMRVVIACVLLSILCFTGYGQNKRKHKKQAYITLHWEPTAEPALIKNINQLRYDSVKIFSFGCLPVLNTQPKGFLDKQRIEGEGIRFGEPIVDSTQHWLPSLADNGHLLSAADTKSVLGTIKNFYHDHYNSESLGCFEPHMGIVFFKDGIVNAHIDVCLTCERIYFEIVKDARVFYRFELASLGIKSDRIFRSIKSKYKLIDCK